MKLISAQPIRNFLSILKAQLVQLATSKDLPAQEERYEVDYQIQDLLVLLPSSHLLPSYQRDHKQYDRFLPCLAKYLPIGSSVIDVGANCGDTVAGMIQNNTNLRFLCVEADDLFYGYLLRNINRIKKALNDPIIVPVRAFAGKSISNISLIGSGGTKRAQTDDSSRGAKLVSESLDHIIQRFGLDPRNVSLLKTDTDGYDYDVLRSCESLLQSNQPIIFYECQTDTVSQVNEYIDLLQWLQSIGYSYWVAFDNFGAVITSTTDVLQIYDLVKYIWRQEEGLSTRTIFYIDILACCNRDSRLINDAINGYSPKGSAISRWV